MNLKRGSPLSFLCSLAPFSILLRSYVTPKQIFHLYFLPIADPNVRLDKCTYFDQARLDQRFEVMDELAISICSKFAKSKYQL